jgi:hypothetical protein
MKSCGVRPGGHRGERAEVELNGCKVSGQPDYAVFRTHFGITSLRRSMPSGWPKSEWIEQLNCYRWLLHKYGVEINHLKLLHLPRLVVA